VISLYKELVVPENGQNPKFLHYDLDTGTLASEFVAELKKEITRLEKSKSVSVSSAKAETKKKKSNLQRKRRPPKRKIALLILMTCLQARS